MIDETPTMKTRAHRIVVGLDFSELSDRAFDAALELSALHEETEVHVLVVGERHGDDVRLPDARQAMTEARAREESREYVASLVDEYRETHASVPVERVAVYVVTGDPAKQLSALAQAVDADLVVVGTHGRRGAERMLLGSVAEGVVRSAPCAVHVVRPPGFVGGKKVPEIQPPLVPGEPHLRPFLHGRTYHHVHRNSSVPARLMPVG